MILLDTNAYVALRRGHRGVLDCIAASTAVLMSTVVVGELLFGFRNGSRFEVNWRQLEQFLAEQDVKTLPVTLRTADHFGVISASLKSRGQPIPTNDIWIAAHAREHRTRLLTFDAHFQRIEGLEVADPGSA